MHPRVFKFMRARTCLYSSPIHSIQGKPCNWIHVKSGARMQTRLSGGRSLGIPIRELGRIQLYSRRTITDRTVKAELEEYYAARSACKRTANNELDAQPRTRDDAQGIAAGVETATARYRPEMVRKASDIRVSTPCTSAGEMEWVRARQLDARSDDKTLR